MQEASVTAREVHIHEAYRILERHAFLPYCSAFVAFRPDGVRNHQFERLSRRNVARLYLIKSLYLRHMPFNRIFYALNALNSHVLLQSASASDEFVYLRYDGLEIARFGKIEAQSLVHEPFQGLSFSDCLRIAPFAVACRYRVRRIELHAQIDQLGEVVRGFCHLNADYESVVLRYRLSREPRNLIVYALREYLIAQNLERWLSV